MDIKTVATHFDDVKWQSDDSFMARCPCHNDNDPSLKISLNKQNGKTWVNGYCFAGCEKDTIKQMLRDKGLNKFVGSTSTRTLKDKKSGDTFVPKVPKKEFEAQRDILHQKYGWNNVHLYWHQSTKKEKPKMVERKGVLYERPIEDKYSYSPDYLNFFIARVDKPNGNKDFFPYTLWKDKVTKEHKWLCKGPPQDYKRVPYFVSPVALTRNPRTILIHEGEKACRRAYDLLYKIKEVQNVSWSGGAKAVDKTNWNELYDRGIEEFILFPDNDDEGRKAMNDVAQKLIESGARIHIADTSGMPEKWDWGDIPPNSEETLEKVKQIWKDAKEYEPPEEPEEVTEQSDYIYCNTQEKFMNINHGFFLTEKGYKNAMRRSLGNTNGVNEWFANPNNIQVDRITFDPKLPHGFNEINGTTFFNEYKPHNPKRVEGDVTPFLNHMEYLVDCDLNRKNMIQRLAYAVQNPGHKIKSALLMFSEAEGVGKTTLFKIIAYCIGQQYCTQVQQHEVAGKFNSWARNKLVVAIEEIAIKGDHQKRTLNMDKFKFLITEEIIRVEEKNDKPFEIPNNMFILMFSNNPAPITISKDSRRYHIWNVEHKKKPVSYYNYLYDWLENKDGYAIIYDYLMKVDLTGFEPSGEPPKTKYFRELVDRTQNPIETELDLLYQSNSWPFSDDTNLVSPMHLKEALKTMKVFAGIHLITDWLKKNGFSNLNKQIDWLNSQRPTIWTNNPEGWQHTTPAKLREFYLEPRRDQNDTYFVNFREVRNLHVNAGIEDITIANQRAQ